MTPQNIKSIYLIAICGTGMASFAGLLKASGYLVTGSDNHVYPPMSTLLTEAGIDILPGFRRENISSDIDLVIVGNAVSKDNEEVRAVMDAGLAYTSFPEALSRFLLRGRKSLVVAGTHGKTTTSALLSWVLSSAGKKPGFLVGGWMKNFDRNYRVPEGDYFVVEGDEYDTAFFDKGPKFLHYRPHAAILTGIEFDHADIFRDLDHVKSFFSKFVKIIDPAGFLLVKFSDRNIQDVLAGNSGRVETYGLKREADWGADSYRFEDGHACFTLCHHGREVGDFRLPMIGRYNTENAVAVAAMAMGLGLSAQEVREAFAGFQGIKRRQEVVGQKNGVTVIDDFAHHPTAIGLTVDAVKEAYPRGRVFAVFEPRSASSRRNIFQETFPASFLGADEAIIAGLFSPEKIPPEDRLDPARLVDDIGKKGGKARFIAEVGQIVDYLAEQCRPDDAILVMSSGAFDGIHQKLLDRL